MRTSSGASIEKRSEVRIECLILRFLEGKNLILTLSRDYKKYYISKE